VRSSRSSPQVVQLQWIPGAGSLVESVYILGDEGEALLCRLELPLQLYQGQMAGVRLTVGTLATSLVVPTPQYHRLLFDIFSESLGKLILGEKTHPKGQIAFLERLFQIENLLLLGKKW